MTASRVLPLIFRKILELETHEVSFILCFFWGGGGNRNIDVSDVI